MLINNKLGKSRIEAALEDSFVPKQQATFIDNLEKIEELLTELNFNSLMIRGNFSFTDEAIYIGMPLNKFHKYSSCNPYETIAEEKIKPSIIAISKEDGLQVKIKNYFSNNLTSSLYIPILSGIILEQYIETQKHKAVFLITMNLLDLNEPNSGIMKLNIS